MEVPSPHSSKRSGGTEGGGDKSDCHKLEDLKVIEMQSNGSPFDLSGMRVLDLGVFLSSSPLALPCLSFSFCQVPTPYRPL